MPDFLVKLQGPQSRLCHGEKVRSIIISDMIDKVENQLNF